METVSGDGYARGGDMSHEWPTVQYRLPVREDGCELVVSAFAVPHTRIVRVDSFKWIDQDGKEITVWERNGQNYTH